MPTQINRDPFARETLERQVAPSFGKHAGPCAFCGQLARFNYRVSSDGGLVGPWSKPFCGVGCYRAYGS